MRVITFGVNKNGNISSLGVVGRKMFPKQIVIPIWDYVKITSLIKDTFGLIKVK